MQKENIIKNYQQLWQKQNLTNGSEKKITTNLWTPGLKDHVNVNCSSWSGHLRRRQNHHNIFFRLHFLEGKIFVKSQGFHRVYTLHDKFASEKFWIELCYL